MRADCNRIYDSAVESNNLISFAYNLGQGIHAFLIYEDPQEARRAEFAYLSSGLEKGYSAVYLTSMEKAEDVLLDMEEFGINVNKYMDNKMLFAAKITSPAEHPLGVGMGLRYLMELISSNVKQPFRIVGRVYRPMTKELIQKNLQVEIESNLSLKGQGFSAICSYDSSLCNPQYSDSWFLAMLNNHDALMTAPKSRKGIGFMLSSPKK